MRTIRKLCKGPCGTYKIPDDFWKQPGTKDGLRYFCKVCDNERRKWLNRERKMGVFNE